MSMIHTLLGVMTDFSLGQSAIPSEEVVKIAKRLGQTHIAIADTMNVSALIDVSKAAQKEGIELHMGVRVRIVDNADQRNKEDNKAAYYPKVWAKTPEGMRSIFRLLSRATQPDRFFYVARLSLDDLLELDPAHVLITTGDAQGVLTRPDYIDIWERLRAWSEDATVEFVNAPTPYFERININAYNLINATNIPAIVTTPVLFDDGKYDALKLNMAIHNRSDFRRPFTVSDPWFKDFHPRDPSQFMQLLKGTAKGMKSSVTLPNLATMLQQALQSGTQWFLDETAYRWAKEPLALPSLAPDPARAVMDQCKAGILKRLRTQVFGYQPSPEDIRDKYLPRLRYEMEVLTTLEFCDYFLVVADLVNWAKSQDIYVGPGRGSVGGSLVAYLMGITDIDPIRFDLLFERFINPSRKDLPDADLDFMSTRREEIIRYLETKYGKEYVGGISNYGVLGSASALKDVARVYGVDMTDFAPSKFIPAIHGKSVDLETAKVESSEIQKFAEANPRVWHGALAVQDMMRSFGRHAAGTIVSGVPLTDRAVVSTDGEGRKIGWDMSTCEDQGLVKLDVLGLSTLDTLSRCVRYIKDRHSIVLDLSKIPLDDADTLKAFSLGETTAIFQFDGGGAKRILRDMAQTSDLTFNDLVAANALNRPGPIDAGLVKDYTDARNGDRIIEAVHPNMEPALAETFNVIVYQEEVMRVSVDLCGFSLVEADALRKIMGKKLPEEMAKMRGQFVDGAVSHSGMDKDDADALFDTIATFAGYAFNKSHAAEYSLISYQCMYCKVHYPAEFYAAALSTVDEKKLQLIVNDAFKNGIRVLPPDVNISTNEFVIGNDKLLFMPFNRIKGVSDKGGQAIVSARNKSSYTISTTRTLKGEKIVSTEKIACTPGKFTGIKDLEARVERRLCNSAAMESLDKVGAFARCEPGQRKALDTTRRRDQMVLLPGLMTGVIEASRNIPTDKFTVARILEVVKEYEAVVHPMTKAPIFHARPSFGAACKFMAVTDSVARTEEMERMFTKGSSFAHTSEALLMAGLKASDGYWTGLVKKRRVGKTLTPGDIKTYAPFLEREVDLLKPPLIITLGSAASRFFVPELKGDMMDHVGRTFFNEKLDAMILVGFSPQRIYHQPELIDTLAELFELAGSVISPK